MEQLGLPHYEVSQFRSIPCSKSFSLSSVCNAKPTTKLFLKTSCSVGAHIYIYIHIYALVQACTCAYVFVYTYYSSVCACIKTYVYNTHIYLYIYVYTHTYIYIYIRICIYTQIHSQVGVTCLVFWRKPPPMGATIKSQEFFTHNNWQHREFGSFSEAAFGGSLNAGNASSQLP